MRRSLALDAVAHTVASPGEAGLAAFRCQTVAELSEVGSVRTDRGGMAIHRTKRPEERARAGRPGKLSAPPPAVAPPHVFPSLVEASDVAATASAVGLKVEVGAPALEDAAARINAAFSDYANATALHANDSPAGQRRRWSAELAAGVAGLMEAMGYEPTTGELGRAAWDGIETLTKGFPEPATALSDRETREKLSRLLLVAVPDKYAEARGRGAEPDLEACWMSLVGRLGAGLAALAMVAASAEQRWDASSARGGSDAHAARRYLIMPLVEVFVTLFGRMPAARAGSAGFRWFDAVIVLVGRRAAARLRSTASTPAAGEGAELPALRAFVTLAGYTGVGASRLDHWLREALRARAKEIPVPDQQPGDPSS